MASAEKIHSKSTCCEVFKHFDRDGNGSLSRVELAALLRRLTAGGAAWDDIAINRVLTAADTNGDGQIQMQEFIDWLLRRAGPVLAASGSGLAGSGGALLEDTRSAFLHHWSESYDPARWPTHRAGE
eukprot:TRINITY_DN7132_c1_g3_i1.p2 TRINITY_DN7132_c1_g3~~TRINITY_DN7132_c1_g3_i1.p2  ORF type:complete len:127 (+),score=13.37 TRINITY_DN7132_c1_g3_i1:46-426(+)